MIVRTLDEVIKSEDRYVESSNWTSRRFLVKKDGMGFSLSETIIHEGSETEIWYKTTWRRVTAWRGKERLRSWSLSPAFIR